MYFFYFGLKCFSALLKGIEIIKNEDVSDLTTLMCAGNPDLSSEPSLEPITVAAEQALQKLRG